MLKWGLFVGIYYLLVRFPGCFGDGSPWQKSRLRYLEDREAAPGTDPKDGLPMDDWVT